MSQQFFQIYIFLRETSVICSRVSREKVTLDEILLKREMIEQGEICNRKNESKDLYGIGRLNK